MITFLQNRTFMKKIAKITLTAILLFVFPFCYAQQFKITQYTNKQGLPTNSIRSIIQDRIGFIWIASDAGLIRYDGKGFEKLPLRSEYVRNICMKKDGNLLVSSDFGVHEVISRQDTVIISTIIPGGILPSDSTVYYPNRLFEDSQGRIWVSQPDGVVSYFHKGQLKHFDMGKRNKTGQSDSHFSFAEDERNTVWIASEPGVIFYYDPDLDLVRELVTGKSKQTIHDLYYMGDGRLWVAGDGLYEIQVGDRRRIGVNKFDYIGLTISKLIVKESGEIFFGTPNSQLYKAKESFGEITTDIIFTYDEKHEVKELPFSEVRDAFVDDIGDIWIASEKGVGLLQTNFFGDIFGVPNLNIYALTELPNGDIYVSTGELVRIYKDFGSWQLEPIPIEGGLNTSVAAGFDRVWVGDAQGNIFYILDHEVSAPISLANRGGSVFYMFGDQDGNLWTFQEPNAMSTSGVSRIIETGPGTFDIKPYEKEQGVDTRVMVAKQRENGYVYFGGIGRDTYLYRYHKKTDSFLNLSVPLSIHDDKLFQVFDIAIDKNEVVYMATSHGLFKYSAERMSRINLGIDITSIEIRAITLNDDGTLWLATDTDGLFQYKEGKIVRFEETSGLPTKIMNYRCLMTDKNQRIWAGTAEGISISQESRPNPKPTPSPTFLQLRVNGEDITKDQSKNSFPNGSDFEASYISLTYPGSGLIYQTRLQAAGRAAEYFQSDDWSPATQKSSFSTKQLPEGFYSFEVRAKQKGGYNWSEPLSFTFDIDKVWYRTWWAYSLYILAGLIIVWVLIRFNTWRLLRDKNKLEDIIQNRTAELIEKNKLLEEQTKEILAQAEDLKAASKEVAEQKAVVEKSYENIKLLTKIGKKIMLSETLDEAELMITNYLNEILDYNSFAIGIPSTDGTGLELSIFKKSTHSKFFKDFVPYSENHSLMMWSWKNEKKLIINDLEKDCKNYIPGLSLKRDDMNYSQIYLPISILGKSIGIMAIQHKHPNHYDEHNLIIFETLGTYVAVMLSRLFELEEK